MDEPRQSASIGDGAPVIEPGYTFGTVTDKISSIVLTRPTSNGWFLGFGIAFLLTMMMLFAVGYLFVRGVGIWGVTIPIGWGFAIVNFVWWIGIGHAGTLISAILLLLRQSWRNSINRFAEAMTLFAVSAAGLFPLIHVGRPWLAYWLFPYPNTMRVWPQFRSPLVWDVFAVSTYATISLLFWFIGLVPDLATLRDRSTNRAAQIIYGMLALGWRGSARHWHRYETAYLGTPCSHRGQFRLRGGNRARMAYDDLPSLLRGGCNLFRLRHGADAGDSDPQILWPRRLYYRTPFAELGKSYVGHGPDRGLWLCH
jgi:Polysulphide reductase, NrfD